MTAESGLKSWLENVLEKPFLEAELARVEMTKVQPGEENMVPVVLLSLYAAGYTAFCSYWAVKLFL